VTVLTGAGVSTGSGIPDFRGPRGTWTRDPEAERLATLDAYLGDPEVRRRSWRWRLEHPAWDAEPNPAHEAVAALERRGYLHTLVTQNTDGLHLLAGHDPERVVEIHGTMREVVCVACATLRPTAEVLARIRAGEDDPRCTDCGGVMKTATVFFGQALDQEALERAQQAASEAEVLVAAGTSLQVYPVAWLPELALDAGARLVIANGEPTSYDTAAHAVLRGPLEEVLPALVHRL
jgi:NAD-dependent deacetylase